MNNQSSQNNVFSSSQLEFVALDIETTGLNREEHEIIEIAALKFSDGEIKSSYTTFVKPRKPIPAFIKKLTNISDQMVNSGLSIKKALSELSDFLGDLPLVCHNAVFDVEFINTKLIENRLAALNNRVYDTLTLSQVYFPFTLNHKLETMIDHFGLELEGAHRAVNDAEATGWLFLEMVEYILSKVEVKTNYLLYEMAGFAKEYSDLDRLLEILVEEQRVNALTREIISEEPRIDYTHIRNEIDNSQNFTLKEVFSRQGLLSKVYTDYESRTGQLQMAEEIAQALDNKKHLLVEAGTGVGKSLAYLIPALQYSQKTSNRIVISTNTKNLQEQIFSKDLPLLKKCLPIPFEAVLLKGRGNYICEKKWQDVMRTWKRTAAAWEVKDLMRLVIWKKQTKTGDIVENSSFNTAKMSSTWKKVVADRHFCRGKRCHFSNQCHFMKKRIMSEKANLVVINHHLLLADAATDNSALGEYSQLIIDEAHNLPNTAHNEFGFSLSWPDIQSFFTQLFHIRKEYQSGELITLKRNLQSSKTDPLIRNEIIKNIEVLINIINESKEIIKPFFWEMGQVVKRCTKYGKLSYFEDSSEYKTSRLKQKPDFSFLNQTSELINCFEAIAKSVKIIKGYFEKIDKAWLNAYDQHADAIKRIEDRIEVFQKQLSAFMQPVYDESAYWFSVLNVSDSDYPAGVMNLVPLDISELMEEYFYGKLDSIVFTSATLAIRGIFKYYERRMGLNLTDNKKIKLKVVDSPFDYTKQALVLNTSFLPHYSDPFFFPQSLDFIAKACQRVTGGTLVLFTSYYDMDNAYKKLAEILPNDFKLMIQTRTNSRSSLLKQFKEDGRGVLLGTSSFWEGVDVPGEALSQIIIYKLPFPSPGDPFVEAYTQKLDRAKKNPFDYFTLPEALLKYRQGYGRLVRSQKDTGVIIVLDNRIARKRERYGKYFLQVIPSQTIFCRNPEEAISRITDWFLKEKLHLNKLSK